jgi:ABC-type Fe3+-siderophore transport system permease subunit
MLYTLGIGSAVALASAVITVICDQFPHFKYWMVTLAICAAGFIVGLVYITPVRESKYKEIQIFVCLLRACYITASAGYLKMFDQLP